MAGSVPILSPSDAEELVRLSRTQGADAAATRFPCFRLLDLSAAKSVFSTDEIIDWSCIAEMSADAADYCFTRFGLAKDIDGNDATCLLSFDGLEAIDTETATVLGGYTHGSLSLNGLTRITIPAAQALARLRYGQLHLDGISRMSADCLRTLLDNYDGVTLNGFYYLGEEHVPALKSCGYTGSGCWRLTLSGVAYMSEAAADALAHVCESIRNDKDNLDGGVTLDGLRVLNSANLAREAVLDKWGFPRGILIVSFDAIETITYRAALVIAEHSPGLAMPNLRDVSPDIGRLLGRGV